METPPRAWGRRKWPSVWARPRRNTPTGVGKTLYLGESSFSSRKHPHGRGEDSLNRLRLGLHVETPPRAWGRPFPAWLSKTVHRNTPTGVGKTGGRDSSQAGHRKHPHGRGEDPAFVECPDTALETPPRAWGRRLGILDTPLYLRNTPTGVGKTSSLSLRHFRPQKHPHGRGEDKFYPNLSKSKVETPPRAWGRLAGPYPDRNQKGNTPTGVGKTCWLSGCLFFRLKHPHGRGEDPRPRRRSYHRSETPPRAWGRL